MAERGSQETHKNREEKSIETGRRGKGQMGYQWKKWEFILRLNRFVSDCIA